MTPATLLASTTPVLLHFYKEGCAASRLMSRSLQQLNAEEDLRYQLIKVNYTEEEAFAKAFEVTDAPETLLVMNGAIVYRQFGVVKANELQEQIDIHLNS